LAVRISRRVGSTAVTAPGCRPTPRLPVSALRSSARRYRGKRLGDHQRAEYKLLGVLARNRGRLMTHRALLTEVWGPQYAQDTHLLRTHVANLRRKISPGGEPRYIRTEAGVGYRFLD
jgi:DNA-binding response OmpR family regulator